MATPKRYYVSIEVKVRNVETEEVVSGREIRIMEGYTEQEVVDRCIDFIVMHSQELEKVK